MTECSAHVGGGWDEKRHGLFCSKCGVELCTDCGSTPVWHYSSHGYCRRCGYKGGHTYDSNVGIDPDKLEARVGRELAEAILKECCYTQEP